MLILGISLSAQLKAGDLILINGPLGAGKTVLAQGIGKGLGIDDITSPTFVISRTHKAVIPMIHVDAYRLIDTENPNLYLDDLDLDTENSVTVVEWGGAESARLSEDRLEISIDRTNEIRQVEIKAIGARWDGFAL
ncbi:tRNA threonylcarbamoyladenosine biosynthesis protein TsaE [Candidatus Planktophila vernalis]|uniref:tRNA threonylcarbamoyladenosine biosynthesis protein TsaE n=2 Tax=Candidatus Planktophila vernalis TaxID=1884907 RepID=A0A249KUY7_9ACTN|nr:tRNA threonylcarbamoyladenosine biosynthesis protein TsaE [Candidatus Planktophila vernalis]